MLRVPEGWAPGTKNKPRSGIRRKHERERRYNYRGGYGQACAKGSNWLQKGFA
jgi:hypothetical protein